MLFPFAMMTKSENALCKMQGLLTEKLPVPEGAKMRYTGPGGI
jgi:hypothetical protein